jgi:hypothetical protein
MGVRVETTSRPPTLALGVPTARLETGGVESWARSIRWGASAGPRAAIEKKLSVWVPSATSVNDDENACDGS